MQSLAEILEIYRENPLLRGMTFSGGEPFCEPAPLVLLAGEVHCLGGDVVCYTGYYYETLRKLAASGADDVGNLLDAVDLLIDGPYIESLRNLELLFRGSSNQRILDRQAMRKLDEAGMPASSVSCLNAIGRKPLPSGRGGCHFSAPLCLKISPHDIGVSTRI